MANLGLKNKNAGNLRDPATGNFQVFKTPEEGEQALLKDLEIKKSGKSAHIKPGGTIADLGNVWAPPSDNNVPNEWAGNVAKSLGLKPDSKWADIPTDRLAYGIQVAEGTTTPKTVKKAPVGNLAVAGGGQLNQPTNQPTGKMSLQQFGESIQKKYPEYADKDATLVGQKVLDKYPQYADRVEGTAGPQFPLTSQKDTPPPTAEQTQPGANQPIPGVMDQVHQGNITGAISSGIRKLGNFVTGGGSETMGNTLGTNIGYGIEKAKGMLGGQDNSKYYDMSQPTTKEAIGAGLKVGGAIATTVLGGKAAQAGVNWLTKGALSKPAIRTILEGSLNTKKGETLANLSRQEAQMTLQNYLREMPITEVGGSTARSVVKALQELDPSFTKPAGFVKNLVKYGVSTLIIENLVRKVFGDRASSALGTMVGMINP